VDFHRNFVKAAGLDSSPPTLIRNFFGILSELLARRTETRTLENHKGAAPGFFLHTGTMLAKIFWKATD
jgi:hypothetical protein